jgi:hypothetical protein
MKKEQEIYYHAFNVGDVVSSQDNKRRVILEVCAVTKNFKVPTYKFMHLDYDNVNILSSGTLLIKRGEISEQPIDIMDKYFYLYQFKPI